MNTHDIELPPPAQRIPYIGDVWTRDQVCAAIEADRKRRYEEAEVDTPTPEDMLSYAMYIAHERELRIVGHKHDEPNAIERFNAAVQRLIDGHSQRRGEPVDLDRYDAGLLGGQDGMPSYVWHDIIRAELDRAYDFYMDQIDRAALQSQDRDHVDWMNEFERLLDSYQDAQRNGTLDDRVQARAAIKAHARRRIEKEKS